MITHTITIGTVTMKRYKITILPHFKNIDLEQDFVPQPIVQEIYAKSFMEAVGDGMRMVGVLEQQWDEFTHELVSVRQEKTN